MGSKRGRHLGPLSEASSAWEEGISRYATTQKDRTSVPAEEWKVLVDDALEALSSLQSALHREQGRGFGPEDVVLSPGVPHLQSHTAKFFGVPVGVFNEGFRPNGSERERTYEYFPSALNWDHVDHAPGNFLVFAGEEYLDPPGHVLLRRSRSESFNEREQSLAREECKGEIIRRIRRRIEVGPASLYDYSSAPF